MFGTRLAKGVASFPNDTSFEEAKSFYDGFSATYDEFMDSIGWVAAKNTTEKVLQHLSQTEVSKDVRIMDLAAGTGKVGEILKQHGYENIDGEDISPGMIEKAQKKGVYKRLICEGLGEKRLSVDDATYDVVICVGIFTIGLVRASTFHDVVRITKPGGLMFLTIRNDALHDTSYGFKSKINELCKEKVWEVLKCIEIEYNLDYPPESRNGHVYICKKL